MTQYVFEIQNEICVQTYLQLSNISEILCSWITCKLVKEVVD